MIHIQTVCSESCSVLPDDGRAPRTEIARYLFMSFLCPQSSWDSFPFSELIPRSPGFRRKGLLWPYPWWPYPWWACWFCFFPPPPAPAPGPPAVFLDGRALHPGLGIPVPPLAFLVPPPVPLPTFWALTSPCYIFPVWVWVWRFCWAKWTHLTCRITLRLICNRKLLVKIWGFFGCLNKHKERNNSGSRSNAVSYSFPSF